MTGAIGNDEADYGPPERYRHDDIEFVAIKTRSGRAEPIEAAKVMTQTTLDRLRRKHPKTGKCYITQDQFDAGERLHKDWYTSGLSPHTTVDLTGLPGAQGLELTERVVQARQKFNAAMVAVGSGLNDVLWEVCCSGWRLRDIEHRRGWRRGVGLAVVRLALTELVRYYQTSWGLRELRAHYKSLDGVRGQR